MMARAVALVVLLDLVRVVLPTRISLMLAFRPKETAVSLATVSETSLEWSGLTGPDECQYSRDAVTSDLGFRSWGEFRGYPVYAMSYWFSVEGIDNITEAVMCFCAVDPETFEVAC